MGATSRAVAGRAYGRSAVRKVGVQYRGGGADAEGRCCLSREVIGCRPWAEGNGRIQTGSLIMKKPLRIVDLTNGWAGPLGTCLLADFGAEVIKVESPSHMDWWRGAGLQGSADGPKLYEQSPTFNTVNRNK